MPQHYPKIQMKTHKKIANNKLKKRRILFPFFRRNAIQREQKTRKLIPLTEHPLGHA